MGIAAAHGQQGMVFREPLRAEGVGRSQMSIEHFNAGKARENCKILEVAVAGEGGEGMVDGREEPLVAGEIVELK